MTRQKIFMACLILAVIFSPALGITADIGADIDGNGIVDPLTDGILFMRYTLGFTGSDLTRGAVGANAKRTSAADIETYLNNLGVCGSSTPTNPTSETFTNSVGMTFKLIPAGTFMMGSPADEQGRLDDESPQHQVTLTQAFYMQTTEVTQGQWRAVVGTNPSHVKNCGDNCPVETVSWNDIQSFIGFMNQRGEGTYRLPTEAEWEYAARAGSTTAFANGGITVSDWVCSPVDPNLDAMGWYCGNSGSTTHPVAQKQANAWGLYDMHGNVWEWVSDWYGTYPTGDSINPTGPSTGAYRVLRGGGWGNIAGNCRSAGRGRDSPGARSGSYGFRLVCTSGQR